MTVKLTKSVTFNRQEDAAILRKLRRAGKFDSGNWSPFVRELIRRWAEGEPLNDAGGSAATVAPADIVQAIAQALDERRLDLASIRQTLESTIGSAGVATASEPEEAPADWLDILEEGAIL